MRQGENVGDARFIDRGHYQLAVFRVSINPKPGILNQIVRV
jgi:hypothetical protein